MLKMPATEQTAVATDQALYLVYGGKIEDPQIDDFVDPAFPWLLSGHFHKYSDVYLGC